MARCKECGLKIRGSKHTEGDDHKRAADRRANADRKSK